MITTGTRDPTGVFAIRYDTVSSGFTSLPFTATMTSPCWIPALAAGVPGWTVQVLEQMENNILIRPLTLYNGPPARDYVALQSR